MATVKHVYYVIIYHSIDQSIYEIFQVILVTVTKRIT